MAVTDSGQTLGLCFTTSGVRRRADVWNRAVARTMQSLLMTAVAPYMLVSSFYAYSKGIQPPDPARVYRLLDFYSRGVSVILLVLFLLYRLFRKTHSSQFEQSDRIQHNLRTIQNVGSGTAALLLLLTISVTYVYALSLLKAVTAYEEPWATPTSVPSQEMFSFCFLPLLAELAELSRICVLAYHGEMDVVFEVVTTTSMHTLLFIAPIFCLLAWCMGNVMDLHLGDFEVITLFLNIWVFSLITRYSESNYFHGVTIYGL